MKLLRTLGAALLAGSLMAVAPPAAQAEIDVYSTPGNHVINGRQWRTTCAKYSTSVVRCTTHILATQVTYSNGRYVTSTGWVFNNLTYLPSLRSTWRSNPLAAYGRVGGTAEWTAGGRKWRTQCDTAATGRGGCRSYIWATYIVSSGSRHSLTSGWLFNNLVRFAEGGVAPVTTVPPWRSVPCDSATALIRQQTGSSTVTATSCVQSTLDPNWIMVVHRWVDDRAKELGNPPEVYNYDREAFFQLSGGVWTFRFASPRPSASFAVFCSAVNEYNPPSDLNTDYFRACRP